MKARRVRAEDLREGDVITRRFNIHDEPEPDKRVVRLTRGRTAVHAYTQDGGREEYSPRDSVFVAQRDAVPPSSRRFPQTPGAYRFAVTTALIREHRMTDGRARGLVDRWERLVESRRETGRSPSSTAEHVARFESQHIASPYPRRDKSPQSSVHRKKSGRKSGGEKPVIDKEALLRAMNRAGYDVRGQGSRRYAKRIYRRSDGRFMGEMDAREAFAWLKGRAL